MEICLAPALPLTLTETLFPWPRNTLAFRSRHTDQHIIIASERAPFALVDEYGPANSLNLSTIAPLGVQRWGWIAGRQPQLLMSNQIWHTTRHSMKR
jgi:hypothetical protein